MNKTREGSTQQLLQLCAGYFFAYLVTGVTVKYFTGKAELGFPGLLDAQFLVYSTFGGSLICIAWVVLRKWWYWPDAPKGAIWYIIPSGICTAVVIPTTTMMYMLPISIMVAQVIMRGALIVIGRTVDEIQIRQGILHRKVYQEENTAVLFALSAVGVQLFFEKGDFDFLNNVAAMTILSAYLTAYAIRIYTMNYYKNTRPKGAPQNNEWFFAIEQVASTITLVLVVAALMSGLGGSSENVEIFRGAVSAPQPIWPWAAVAGSAFGIAAFFSVFLFMFKGRTATFANLVNRLTSLLAGTSSTLVFAVWFGGKYPKPQDWISLLYILIAVVYLGLAEQRRVAELAKTS